MSWRKRAKRMAPLWLLLNAVFSLSVGPRAALACHRPGSSIQNALRSIRTFVMQIDMHAEDCKVQHYRGSMYGVTAKVALNMHMREAKVQLYGIPIGGTVEGVGWLLPNADADGEVPYAPGPYRYPTDVLPMLPMS